ncbi:MAG: CRISPR-associated helicase Cas3' [Candidatus Thorarchaeota archaeon]
MRSLLYQLLENNLDKNVIGKILTVTAPTGAGKTLAILNYALRLRQLQTKEKGAIPRIIYCLPFISIIDQVAGDLTEILGLIDQIQNEKLTVDHHLADIQWDPLNEDEPFFDYFDVEGVRDFVKLWRSDIVITTFVKFWCILINGTKRRMIGLNRIAGSIIILDEVQNIPSRYWDITYFILKELTATYSCTILLATATQPLIIPKSEQMELAPEYMPNFFQMITTRYNTIFMNETYELTEFCELFYQDINNKSINQRKNIMIVMNTKKNARYVYDHIQTTFTPEQKENYFIFFLSSWVIPAHRQQLFKKIKKELKNRDRAVILVCTQVIEAGVDVSFDTVYRDFGPLDSIIQVAGRCNRHFASQQPGELYIYPIKDKKGELYAQIVYQDPISLSVTQEITQGPLSTLLTKKVIPEFQLYELGKLYFQLMRERKDTQKCIDALQRFDFYTINKTFRLIEEKDDMKLLFIAWNRAAQDILRETGLRLSQRNRIGFLINSEIYRYCINVTEYDVQKLQRLFPSKIQALYAPKQDKKENEVLFYVLEDYTNLYDEAGLFITDSP